MKQTNYNLGKGESRKTAKYKSHGSYREQRKPNSPRVAAKARQEAARNFDIFRALGRERPDAS